MACTPMITLSISKPCLPNGDAGATGLRRSESVIDLRCDASGMRRSQSEPVLLRCSLDLTKAASAESKLRGSRSVGLFPSSSKTAYDSEHVRGLRLVDSEESGEEEEDGGAAGQRGRPRVGWVERLLELRRQWRDRAQGREEDDSEEGGGHCEVSYDESDGEAEEAVFDAGSFEKLLVSVPWTTTKLLSQLAFLCNMAYVIPEIKAADLKKYYNLDFVTSSLEKTNGLDCDSTGTPSPTKPDPESAAAPARRKRRARPSVAYQIAASAASYVQARARGLLSLGAAAALGSDGDPPPGAAGGCGSRHPGRGYNSEVAACMAASTMAAVVAVEEEAKQEAARGLRSPHSSPCEWFVCDDRATCTRCFVIQGSDSLASWQANLFFEPTKFEGTDSLVHRGIYEAAKGIYDQFMPEVMAHLERYGDRARFRFTGHSLGGSLSLLINLMLLARGVVQKSMLLPVVTFGSPFVFCGGKRVLDNLGFDEGNVYSVVMHRDIVPRAFSCSYPSHVSQILRRLNGSFRTHPCLNMEKLLYSPLGRLFILQPDEKFSPSHPFLPPGTGLYTLQPTGEAPKSMLAGAIKAFLNSPHPLQTLSDPKAYGSEGTILRDHESTNYLKAVNVVLRQRTKTMVRSLRIHRLQQWWPLLTTTLPEHTWAQNQHRHYNQGREVVTGV